MSTYDAVPAKAQGLEAGVFPLFPAMASRMGIAKSRRVALISTFAPRKCGIATFARDIFEQLRRFHPEVTLDVYALTDSDQSIVHADVAGEIREHHEEDYALAARRINESAADVAWLQHEYGIFGGECGELALSLVERLAAPLILTLHTVLAEPSDRQHEILRRLLARASKVMVMSRHSRDLLAALYGVGEDRVCVIEHGAPDRPFGRQDSAKQAMDLEDRLVLTTFGLLGPGKGLERVIEALPAITAAHPRVLYRIVGATHPNLVAREGESYREGLRDLAERLGVADHVAWDNRFVDTAELLDQIEACDIYLTPYPNLQQSTSGTLSYAVALGKAVISTPYLHASELLANGVGMLIEPGCSQAIARAVCTLLDDPGALKAMQKRAYARGRETIWPRFADAGAEMIEAAAADAPAMPKPLLATPGMGAFFAMCDDTGMFQHAIGTVPDRAHGYCLDDNARALILTNLADSLEQHEALRLGKRFAAFLQHAFNPDAGGFRNFLRFDRSWCEEIGSEDSNGRAIWALGHTAGHGRGEDLRWWARGLFDEALPGFARIDSPRAVAFGMLGAAGRLAGEPDHGGALALLERGGTMLHKLLAASRRPDWAWFEAVLGYDNPRLSQALIEAGRVLDRRDWREAGLSSLAWICEQQTGAGGMFRAVGSESFHREHETRPFDQQPLEAQASIDAALSARRVDGDERWLRHAKAAYRWFFGGNDRGVVLADLVSGRCRDGITPQGRNRNCGAESILAFQLSHYGMIALARPQPGDSSGEFVEVERLCREPASHIG